MSPSELEQQALAAGASPAAAAAARAFVEALPEGTAQPKWEVYDLDNFQSTVLVWGTERNGVPHGTIYFSDNRAWICFEDIPGEDCYESEDWRPGSPIPPRVLELIGMVAG